MIRVAVLGVTGSIGQTALRGISENRELFLCAATYHNRKPEDLSCPLLKLDGNLEELKAFLLQAKPDVVLNGVSGSAGLYTSLAVIDCGFTLALANKETVVMGGKLFMDYAASKGVRIIPVDSEHSAIDELIKTNGIDNIDRLVITASGGPFYRTPVCELENVTSSQAVKHPTWNMGPKISIDSSTLANKGLEVIEAHYLFGFDADHIEVVIHPQSVVHSMVRTTSGQVYAQMSPPDMVFPIMRALLDGKFSKEVGKKLDFSSLSLTFEKPDMEKFGFLKDAFDCVRKEGSYPIVFNTANEIAVDAFIRGKIKFTDIYRTVHNTLELDWTKTPESLSHIKVIQEEIARKVRF